MHAHTRVCRTDSAAASPGACPTGGVNALPQISRTVCATACTSVCTPGSGHASTRGRLSGSASASPWVYTSVCGVNARTCGWHAVSATACTRP